MGPVILATGHSAKGCILLSSARGCPVRRKGSRLVSGWSIQELIDKIQYPPGRMARENTYPLLNIVL